MRRDTTLWTGLAETVLITAGGFVFINVLANGPALSELELLMAPASVGVLWIGLTGATRRRPEPAAQ